jgi:hypothetical protein
MFAPTIADYYRYALDAARKEVFETPDERVVGMETEEWATYLITKYVMEPVEVEPGATMTMHETTSERGYAAFRVVLPVVWTDTLAVIAKEGLAGQGAWMGFDYTDFFDLHRFPETIGLMVPDSPNKVNEINGVKGKINEYIKSLNTAISLENETFPDRVREMVAKRRAAFEKRQKDLDNLSAAVGISLVKRADVSTVIPTAVRVRRNVAPVVPPTPKPQKRFALERDKLNAIIELIDSQCRQFERTPSAFQLLSEEGLRDVILSSLNAVFEGAAVGEAFQGLGKVDVHLRISEGEVFVSEVKVWSGPESLAEVVGQLLDRLTWRDAYGVAIVFSKNADFGRVLESIQAALPTLPGAVKGSFIKEGANAFVAGFSLPSDGLRHVEIHVRAYNLYTPRPSRRIS